MIKTDTHLYLTGVEAKYYRHMNYINALKAQLYNAKNHLENLQKLSFDDKELYMIKQSWINDVSNFIKELEFILKDFK